MNKAISESFFSNLLFLFAQIRRILFAGKFYIFLILAVVWNIIASVIGHLVNDPMPLEGVFYSMNMVPMMILALYLSMTLVSYEKENRTIEALFSVPGSPYKVWFYKLAVQFIMLLFIHILLALISFFFVQDFEIELMVVHTFIPVFFVANLNFLLSILVKNGYVAAMITMIIMAFLGIISAIFASTYFNFYLCPFMRPDNLDIDIWNQRLIYNKLAVSALGFLWMYLGLNRLRFREPFIA